MAAEKPTTIAHDGLSGGHRGIQSLATDEDRTHCVRVLGLSDEVVVSGTADSRIARIAGNQRGRISRAQIIQAGISDGALRRRVRRGGLFCVVRSVFAVGHPEPVELGDETAALLAAGDGAVLTGLSAACLWGLLSTYVPPVRPVHVLAPTQRRIPCEWIRVHRSKVLTPADVRTHRGLPTVSPARALLDLAEQAPPRSVELACDRGLVAGLLTGHELSAVARRAPRRHGSVVLRQLIEAGPTTVTRSEAEERVLDLVRSAGLPAPRVNARLHGFEVDFFWPAVGLVLEVDGFRFHASRRAFEHDRRKDATLQAAGVRTMRVTWRQVDAEPYAVVARLAMAVARSAPS